jgi:predicted P-loop ATPase
MKWIVCDDEWGGKLATNYKYMKAKSGQTTSTLRRAYGKDHEDIKRLAMLCGTSNDSDIITDSSNRRIVPIHASSIDLNTYYAIDKTDALIEAYHRYTSGGESPFLNSEENELLQLISSNNTAPDVNEELLSKYYEVCEPGDPFSITMTASDIATFLQSKTQLRISNVVLGKALNRLKFLKITERRNSQPRTVYLVRPISVQTE